MTDDELRALLGEVARDVPGRADQPRAAAQTRRSGAPRAGRRARAPWLAAASIAAAAVLLIVAVALRDDPDVVTTGPDFSTPGASCEPGETIVALTLPHPDEREGFPQVALFDPAGTPGARTTVVTGDWVATEPEFSPDGTRLAVVRADESW
jgi:hypothetical protein